jgi:hypothetical protein
VEDFWLIYGTLGEILPDYSANGCCDVEMVQFVAPFLASTATPINHSVGRYPRSVASKGQVRTASRAKATGRGERARIRSNVLRRATLDSTILAHNYGDDDLNTMPILFGCGRLTH